MHPSTDACKPTRPKTCRNTTFTRLERARPSTKSRHIIGAHCRGCYPARVTVYPYSGYVKRTNPITRHAMSLTWTLKRMRSNQHNISHSHSHTTSCYLFLSTHGRTLISSNVSIGASYSRSPESIVALLPERPGLPKAVGSSQICGGPPFAV